MMSISNEKEFWSVGKSKWNRWQVRKASCDDPYTYELIEDLGPVKKLDPQTGELYEPIKKVGIEYDGQFALGRTDSVVRLTTEGDPWLFVLMADGTLYFKKCEDPLSSVVVLAIGVSHFSVVRSWRNDFYDHDQGLIVVYLKNGVSYYREHLKIGTTVAWGPETLIDSTEGQTGLKCFRLNDFRMAVFLEGVRKLWISSRQYIGNTIRDEHVVWAFIDPELFVLSNRSIPQGVSLLEATSVEFIDDTWIKTTFNYPVFDYDSSWSDISWAGSLPSGEYVKSVIFPDNFHTNYILIELGIPITNHRMELRFHVRSFNRKGYYISENAKPIWPELTWGKDKEPLIVDAGYQGTINGVLSLESCTISNIPMKEYKPKLLEHIKATFDVENISLVNVELTEYKNTLSETLCATLVLESITLINTQSGDTPV